MACLCLCLRLCARAVVGGCLATSAAEAPVEGANTAKRGLRRPHSVTLLGFSAAGGPHAESTGRHDRL